MNIHILNRALQKALSDDEFVAHMLTQRQIQLASLILIVNFDNGSVTKYKNRHGSSPEAIDKLVAVIVENSL